MTTTASTRDGSIAKRTGVSVGLIVGAVVATTLLAGVVGLGAGLAGLELGDGGQNVVGLVATQLAFLLVGFAFLHRALGREFVSVELPTRGEVGVALGGALLVAGVEAIRQLGVRFTALEAASTLPATEAPAPAVALALLAVTILLAPLAEELLFRGVVQQYVAAASSTVAGIAVATVLFVPVHGVGIFAGGPAPTAAAAVAFVIVVLSATAGAAYARTENLAVPILLHATYNLLTPLVALLALGV